ncbi:MAG: FtsX-like permease family protein [Nitrososphaeria archaeon]|nr:FtsX-like permease family protein [Nitrososphaeria archaeon]
MIGLIYYLKIFLLKKGFLQSTFTLSLLIASLSSAYSLANSVAFKTESFSSYIPSSGLYMILNGSTPSESLFNPTFATLLRDSGLSQISLQRLFKAKIITSTCTFEVMVRAVDDVKAFLKHYNVNGSLASNILDANVGELLALRAGVKVGDSLILSLAGERIFKVNVSGVFRSLSQLDSEVIVSLALSEKVFGDGKVSVIEFYSENVRVLANVLPRGLRLLKVQATEPFLEGLSLQTSAFLQAWSTVACTLIAAAFYTVSSRLTMESGYEIGLLRALGARKRLIYFIMFAIILTLSLISSILGTALGVVVVQSISWTLSYAFPGMPLEPFLEPFQAIQITVLALSSSIASCTIYILRWRF